MSKLAKLVDLESMSFVGSTPTRGKGSNMICPQCKIEMTKLKYHFGFPIKHKYQCPICDGTDFDFNDED